MQFGLIGGQTDGGGGADGTGASAGRRSLVRTDRRPTGEPICESCSA